MNKRRCFNIVAPVFSIILVLSLLLVPLAAVPVAHAATTFNVDTLTDAHDTNLGDGVCSNGIDGCSLRAAIEQAFSASAPVTINFWSGLSGSTFYLDASMGQINWTASNTTLDGQTNHVTIDASGLAAGESAFQISGNGNIIQNLTIRGAPLDAIQVGDFAGVGSGNNNVIQYVVLISSGAAGIYVHGSSGGGGMGNQVQGAMIGTETAMAATCTVGNNGSGVLIDGGASGTQVLNSYISCNGLVGVYINNNGGSPDNTRVESNDIGTNGDVAMPNAGQGVIDQGLATIIRWNIISGNGAAGVWLLGSQNAAVVGNYIGLDVTGNVTIPNTADGMAITDGAQNSTVGGSTLAERNYISGNSWCGVRIRDGATSNVLNGNVIGLDANGAAAPNELCGVAVTDADNNTIGSDTNPLAQTISGNTREGIYLSNSDLTWIGFSTFIGVGLDGTADRGNGLEGIILITATGSVVSPAAVRYNGAAGIALTGNGTGNAIVPRQVSHNGGLAIDLGNDGFTPNGSETPPGPNNWLQYPVINGVAGSTISGAACANCLVYVYQAIGNPNAGGGGGIYLGTAAADASGTWSYVLPGGLTPSQVALQAVDINSTPSGDSSEMGPLYGGPVSYKVFLPVVSKHQAP